MLMYIFLCSAKLEFFTLRLRKSVCCRDFSILAFCRDLCLVDTCTEPENTTGLRVFAFPRELSAKINFL